MCPETERPARGPPDVGEEVDESSRYHKGAQRVVCTVTLQTCMVDRSVVQYVVSECRAQVRHLWQALY